jgi:hypothetical protein
MIPVHHELFTEAHLVKRSIILLIFALALLLVPGRAQSDIRLARMEVDLWPEYDRPNLLVIYQAALPAEVTLPIELTFRIPVEAGEPHAVAVQQPDGQLLTTGYTRQVSGDWALITFTATTPQAWLEYYDPGLNFDGRQRRFEYFWPGDYAVDSFVIEVQQPTGSSDMRVSPVTASSNQRQDGFTYNTAEVGSFEAGETFTIRVEYQKAGDALSVDDLEIRPSAPITAPAPGGFDFRTALPWVLGILGLLLLAGGGWWFWRSSQGEDLAPARRRRKPASAPSIPAVPGEGIYCHQCGKRASSGDRFCRSCGARLRVE